MEWYYILSIIISSILLIIFLITLICFLMCFYVPKRKDIEKLETSLPKDELYKKYEDIIFKDIEEAKKLPHKEYRIKSYDGLTLFARYYEYEKDAPIEIMIHGYKGNGRRDLSTGIKRAFACKRNALIIDQRASGNSQGHVITFGIKERKDCLSWVNFVIKEFGPQQKIILTGISMGAATVLMSAGLNLPNNVIGVLADCGYNKGSDIIKKVIKDMKLPVKFFYPFVKLAARIFGGFNLEETSPMQEMNKAKVPIIFYHGDEDTLVPCEMSQKIYDCYQGRKRIVTIKGAGHGVCYLVDPDKYLSELIDFFK